MVLDENEEISDSSSNLSNNKIICSDKVSKIKQIIESHFNEEINYKKLELETIDDVIIFDEITFFNSTSNQSYFNSFLFYFYFKENTPGQKYSRQTKSMHHLQVL